MIYSDFDPEMQNKSMESKIIAALERISQAFRVLLWQESKEFLLTPIQVQVLIFLLHHREELCKISYLAFEFNMTKATISDTIKVLGQKKLITKKFESHDTRSYKIHLTKKGKDIAGKISLFTNEMRVPVEKLHKDDKENMLLGLMDIIRHLNKTGIITIQRMCITCTHFEKSKKGNPQFCKLLNQELPVAGLRIDCPEYEMKET